MLNETAVGKNLFFSEKGGGSKQSCRVFAYIIFQLCFKCTVCMRGIYDPA
jgi:hypothetical protein